jgi:hypothetical protein
VHALPDQIGDILGDEKMAPERPNWSDAGKLLELKRPEKALKKRAIELC